MTVLAAADPTHSLFPLYRSVSLSRGRGRGGQATYTTSGPPQVGARCASSPLSPFGKSRAQRRKPNEVTGRAKWNARCAHDLYPGPRLFRRWLSCAARSECVERRKGLILTRGEKRAGRWTFPFSGAIVEWLLDGIWFIGEFVLL